MKDYIRHEVMYQNEILYRFPNILDICSAFKRVIKDIMETKGKYQNTKNELREADMSLSKQEDDADSKHS